MAKPSKSAPPARAAAKPSKAPKTSTPAATSSKAQGKQPVKSGKGKAVVPVATVGEAEEDEEEDEEDDEDFETEDEDEGSEMDSDEEDEENDGITQEGMQKLMKLLGDDGLNEFDMDVLSSVAGEGDEEDDEEEESEDGEGDDEEMLEYGSGDGSQLEEESDDEEDDEEEITLPKSILKSAPQPKLQLEPQNPDDLALDDLGSEFSVDEDAVPARKVTIFNRPALQVLTDQLSITRTPFPEHLTFTTNDDMSAVDPSDDLNREVAFYKQALSIVDTARKLCKKNDIPFSRPNDYYAEMVKSDVHMERVRGRLIDEATSIKKSEAAKKQRDLKKYGKQIQTEKLKQRAQERKGLDERIRGIKRKREGGAGGDDDMFAVELDDAMEERGEGERGGRGGDKPKMPRHARDNKYGMGGGGKRSKQNTKDSTNDFGPGSGGGRGGRGGARGGRGGFGGGGRGGGAGRGGAGGGKRLGKSRRK